MSDPVTAAPFVYEAEHGGSIFIQEGGFVNSGMDANTGPGDDSLGNEDDVLGLALQHFTGEAHTYDVELPRYRLTIELLP